MRKAAFGFLCVLGLSTFGSADIIYDNFSSWDGSVTNGWLKQAQKFPVPASDPILQEWKSQFDVAMTGMTVNFQVSDVVSGNPGGTVYYNQNAVVPTSGVVQFLNMGVSLVGGGTYAATWDFLGFSGPSIHYTSVDVVPGNGMWWTNGWQNSPTLDQKLTARFVPEPASMAALAVGLSWLARRKRS